MVWVTFGACTPRTGNWSTECASCMAECRSQHLPSTHNVCQVRAIAIGNEKLYACGAKGRIAVWDLADGCKKLPEIFTGSLCDVHALLVDGNKASSIAQRPGLVSDSCGLGMRWGRYT